MLIFKILYYPNKNLRKTAKYVKKINNHILENIKNMLNTMYIKNGIGLAAIQVNINKQIVVIDISNSFNNPIILINPKIIKKEGKIISKEGCLSIPKFYINIERSKKILVKSKNLKNKYYTFKAENLLSICIQHEIDHLNGKLLIDYLK